MLQTGKRKTSWRSIRRQIGLCYQVTRRQDRSNQPSPAGVHERAPTVLEKALCSDRTQLCNIHREQMKAEHHSAPGHCLGHDGSSTSKPICTPGQSVAKKSEQHRQRHPPAGGSSYSTSSTTLSPTFFSRLMISSCRSLVRLMPFTDLM